VFSLNLLRTTHRCPMQVSSVFIRVLFSTNLAVSRPKHGAQSAQI